MIWTKHQQVNITGLLDKMALKFDAQSRKPCACAAIGPMADILQQALLPVVDHDTCSTPDWMGGLVTPNVICARGDGKRGGCSVSHKHAFLANKTLNYY